MIGREPFVITHTLMGFMIMIPMEEKEKMVG